MRADDVLEAQTSHDDILCPHMLLLDDCGVSAREVASPQSFLSAATMQHAMRRSVRAWLSHRVLLSLTVAVACSVAIPTQPAAAAHVPWRQLQKLRQLAVGGEGEPEP